MDVGAFREVVLQRLKARNARSAQFESVFGAYLDLVDKVLAHNSFSSRALRSGSSSGVDTSSECANLQAELQELYRRKTQNDQQLIDTNNRLAAIEKELDRTRRERDHALIEVNALKVKNAALADALVERQADNEHIRDEYLALQTTYNVLESKYRERDEEYQQLIDRYTQEKIKMADLYNRENEEAQKQRLVRLQSDIDEAAKRHVPIPEEKTYEVVENISAFDMVPTRCSLKFEAHDGEINDVKWSPNGQLFATGGSDRKLKLYAIQQGKQELKATLTGCNQAIMRIDFDTDGAQVLGASNDFAIRIWGIDDQRCRQSLTGHSAKVLTACFHAQATQVVSGSHDRTLKLWDLRLRRCWKTLFAGSTVNDVISNDGFGAPIVSGHYDKKIRLWDTRSEGAAGEIEMQGRITSLSLSADRYQLLCSSRDESLCLIDFRNNQVVHTYTAETFRASCDYSRATLSPGNEYCAAGSADGHVFVWNVRTTKIEKILGKGHEHPVLACAWHPRGHMLLSVDRTTHCLCLVVMNVCA